MITKISFKRIFFAVMLIMLAGLSVSGWAEESTSSSQMPQKQTVKASSPDAYHNVYKDPVSGKFVSPPDSVSEVPPLDLSTMQQNLSTSSEGLSEKAALKGKMVRLKGRFQDATIVTIDVNGEIVPTPSSSISGAVQQKIR